MTNGCDQTLIVLKSIYQGTVTFAANKFLTGVHIKPNHNLYGIAWTYLFCFGCFLLFNFFYNEHSDEWQDCIYEPINKLYKRT